jgi:hypothetical protein
MFCIMYDHLGTAHIQWCRLIFSQIIHVPEQTLWGRRTCHRCPCCSNLISIFFGGDEGGTEHGDLGIEVHDGLRLGRRTEQHGPCFLWFL